MSSRALRGDDQQFDRTDGQRHAGGGRHGQEEARSPLEPPTERPQRLGIGADRRGGDLRPGDRALERIVMRLTQQWVVFRLWGRPRDRPR